MEQKYENKTGDKETEELKLKSTICRMNILEPSIVYFIIASAYLVRKAKRRNIDILRLEIIKTVAHLAKWLRMQGKEC